MATMDRAHESGFSAEDGGVETSFVAPTPWWAVARAVDQVGPAARWRESVAAELHRAAGGHHALVFTCPLNRPERGAFAVSPRAYGPLNERLMGEYMPDLARSGEGWPRLYQRCGVVCPVMTALDGVPVAEGLRRDLLEPAGVAGYLCAFLVTPREDLAGWFVLATRRPEAEVLAEVAAPLRSVAERAAAMLAGALDLAESCGATFPAPASCDASLSPRERQVLALVTKGFSDVNVAAHLSITEATVGSHLTRIFRKLRVHSRVELVTRARPTH
jgi:DNA-binding CsgD family transcriptional regulator